MKGCHPGGDPVGLNGPDGIDTFSSYKAGRDDMITIIKSEVERLKGIGGIVPLDNREQKAGYESALIDIETFLSTLESEKPMNQDELEEEIDRFEDWMETYNQADYPTSFTTRDIARHFAKWGAEHLKK